MFPLPPSGCCQTQAGVEGGLVWAQDGSAPSQLSSGRPPSFSASPVMFPQSATGPTPLCLALFAYAACPLHSIKLQIHHQVLLAG